MAEPSRKRPRTRNQPELEFDSTATTELVDDLSPCTKESSLWFDDGNVVLQAEATQYKVHRGVVSLHSAILQNLLKPSSEDVKPEVVEDCPLFVLKASSADLTLLLNYTYNIT